jgi:hypothetical protein
MELVSLRSPGAEGMIMKTASALTLLAVGAILTFAITAEPPGINLRVVGVVLMVVGVAGFVIPRRGYGWLRRRMVVRRGPAGPVTRTEETRYPPYVMLNPGASSTPEEAMAEAQATADAPPAQAGAPPGTANSATAPLPAEETVEEYVEEE